MQARDEALDFRNQAAEEGGWEGRADQVWRVPVLVVYSRLRGAALS